MKKILLSLAINFLMISNSHASEIKGDENLCVDYIVMLEAIDKSGDYEGKNNSLDKILSVTDGLKSMAIGAEMNRICRCTNKTASNLFGTDITFVINSLRKFLINPFLKSDKDFEIYIARYGKHKVADASKITEAKQLNEVYLQSHMICMEQNKNSRYNSNFY